MPSTTNFGWTTPADTDLVKDGAAAIRTLGNGVDASFVDLKGGTTGQILSKNSNTDLDFTWIANDQGDITEVTAGTGLTGGGTAGAVTLTNDMATTITAAGDIVVGTGSGTYDNLPIGTTGQVLTADTTVSPYKVKWASPTTPSFVGAYLYRASDVSISNNVLTAISYSNETFDTDNFHDNATNNTRLTIPTGKGGKYLVYAKVRWANSATGARFGQFKINNTTTYNCLRCVGQLSGDTTIFTYSDIYNLSAGDYVEHVVLQNSGGNLNFEGGSTESAFGCIFLGV